MKAQIELYRIKDPIVNDAYDRIAFQLLNEQEKNGSKSFLLSGQVGGVGTTTVAVELSIALATAGQRVLLMDGDLRKGLEGKRLNENVTAGMAEYIYREYDLKSCIYATNWSGLHYIPCGMAREDAALSLLYSELMTTLLDTLKSRYDFLIIDAPPVHTFVDSFAFATKADAVILVCALDGSPKKHLEEAYANLTNAGANLIGVIENKMPIKQYQQYIRDFDRSKGLQK